MKDGKKTVAQNVLYSTFEKIAKEKGDPITVFEKALDNVGPKQEVKAKRVGGANYQVPQEVRPEEEYLWQCAGLSRRHAKDQIKISEFLKKN